MAYDDMHFLRSVARPRLRDAGGSLSVVDLFAGCGGLTVGLWEAARRSKRKLDVALAVDIEPVMVGTLKRNVRDARALAARVEDVFAGDPGSKLTPLEERIAGALGPCDFLVGGPPCQGHSDLNNHTRRIDDRNQLYLRMARAAAVLQPTFVLIENVPAVRKDATNVVAETVKQLEKLDYSVSTEIVDLSRLGVPQHRRRHLLIATRAPAPEPDEIFAHVGSVTVARTVKWAIDDLRTHDSKTSFDTASTSSDENRRRIEYLFEHKLYDLPDAQRPPCHRDKEHSYRAVYGRMRWNEVAPTITTGFGSMGQGRFVHPSRHRTITPHEAARLQTFPDWFTWGGDAGRSRLATMIGNAVPPMLMLRVGEFVIPHILDS